MPTLAQTGAFLLAIGLGVVVALSFLTQLQLQRQAARGEPNASLFKRITMAGLSYAGLFGAILAAKETALPYEAFALTFFAAASVAFIIR